MSAFPSADRYIYWARNTFVSFDSPSLNFSDSLSINPPINSPVNPPINSSINSSINSPTDSSTNPPINSFAGLIFNVFIYSSLINLAATISIDFKEFSSRFSSSRFSSIFFKREDSFFTSVQIRKALVSAIKKKK